MEDANAQKEQLQLMNNDNWAHKNFVGEIPASNWLSLHSITKFKLVNDF